jgi:hypothetical protein
MRNELRKMFASKARQALMCNIGTNPISWGSPNIEGKIKTPNSL